jgi:hypothetical protein
MSDPIGAAQPAAITTAHNFLGQKTETNNLALERKALPRATLSIGYIYRGRTIGYKMPLITARQWIRSCIADPGAAEGVGSVLGAISAPRPKLRE